MRDRLPNRSIGLPGSDAPPSASKPRAGDAITLAAACQRLGCTRAALLRALDDLGLRKAIREGGRVPRLPVQHLTAVRRELENPTP